MGLSRMEGGTAAVIWDWEGNVIAAIASPLHKAIDAEHSETFAVLRCMELAEIYGLPNFVLESDCQVVMRRL